MSTLITIPTTMPSSTSFPRHPLEPLSAEEVRAAVGLLKRSGKVTPTTRFVSVAIHEPHKSFVHGSIGDRFPAPGVCRTVRQRRQCLLRGHALIDGRGHAGLETCARRPADDDHR